MKHQRKSLWGRFTDWLQSVKWWCQGKHADIQLAEGGERRDEASEQLARIIFETGIRPDAVKATTMRGGPCFQVEHEDASEAFIHNTYTEAADEVIDWLQLQGDEITPKKLPDAPVMNRKQRRDFERRRRGGYKRQLKKGKTVH